MTAPPPFDPQTAVPKPATAAAGPEVAGFYDEETNSVAYVAADPATKRCAIVDPVLGFDRACGGTHTGFADRMAAFVRDQGLAVEWILDTHPHGRWCINRTEIKQYQ